MLHPQKLIPQLETLKKNFSTSAADTAEQKRQKKRKIENEWKTKDGKKKCSLQQR